MAEEHRTLLECELPGLPPTVNHLYRSMRNGQRYKTADGRQWQEGATLVFARLKKNRTPCKERVGVKIVFYPADNRAWDVDNRVKALQDCLAPAGVIVNDKQVAKLDVERREKVKDAKTRVIVWALVAD